MLADSILSFLLGWKTSVLFIHFKVKLALNLYIPNDFLMVTKILGQVQRWAIEGKRWLEIIWFWACNIPNSPQSLTS